MTTGNNGASSPVAPQNRQADVVPRDHGPDANDGLRPRQWGVVADPEVRRVLNRFLDPALSDENKRILLDNPEVQRILSSFGIFHELEAVRQLLEYYLPYLRQAQAELQRQTTAVEALDSRERAKNRWGTFWQALSLVTGNLPALASLGMHLLGLLNLAQTVFVVVASLAVNALFFTVRRYLRERHHR